MRQSAVMYATLRVLSVRPSVCLSVCPSVFLPIRPILGDKSKTKKVLKLWNQNWRPGGPHWPKVGNVCCYRAYSVHILSFKSSTFWPLLYRHVQKASPDPDQGFCLRPSWGLRSQTPFDLSLAHWHSARWAWNGYQPGLGSIPRPGRINCFRIIGVHALRLISRTGKRVWRCPL